MEKILSVESLLELKEVERSQEFERIINCIVYNAESKAILDLLEELRSYLELPRTIDMLGNELVYRCAENALTIEECCDAIEVLTQCRRPEMVEKFWSGLCLERFPLNFVNRIFNPYFLDVLHAKTQPERMDIVRGKLKLFDTGLTLECADYDGPLLPRDHSAKAVFHDGRIKRIVNYITSDLEELAGGAECMTKFSVLQHLPVNSLYLVDVIFHPPGLGNIFTINTMKERNINVAVLVHLPEYYDSTGTYLSGSQVMRIRHLRRLGLKVVTLRFDTLHKLKIHPKELRQYLVERIKNAQEALPALEGIAPLTRSS